MGIVSANGRQAMIEHARALKARGAPTWIDPSHGLPLLGKEELVEMIDGATGYFVNDYANSCRFVFEDPAKRPSRRSQGLPEDKFIFANFN